MRWIRRILVGTGLVVFATMLVPVTFVFGAVSAFALSERRDFTQDMLRPLEFWTDLIMAVPFAVGLYLAARLEPRACQGDMSDRWNERTTSLTAGALRYGCVMLLLAIPAYYGPLMLQVQDRLLRGVSQAGALAGWLSWVGLPAIFLMHMQRIVERLPRRTLAARVRIGWIAHLVAATAFAVCAHVSPVPLWGWQLWAVLAAGVYNLAVMFAVLARFQEVLRKAGVAGQTLNGVEVPEGPTNRL